MGNAECEVRNEGAKFEMRNEEGNAKLSYAESSGRPGIRARAESTVRIKFELRISHFAFPTSHLITLDGDAFRVNNASGDLKNLPDWEFR
jgi:hypothetical protein